MSDTPPEYKSNNDVNVKVYSDCILALRDCKPVEGIEILDILKITLVNSYQKELDKQKLTGLFNLHELNKNWEEDFDNWNADTLKLTEVEQRIIDRLTSGCLPRHMPIHDWNLPYAEACILIIRQELVKIAKESKKDAQVST